MRLVQLILAIATAIGSVGLAAGGIAGALMAAEMSGGSMSAGLPLGAVVAGSAGGALLISRVTQRADRIAGLMLGYWIGAAGAALVVVAAVVGNFGLVVAGNLVMGAANAAVYLTRYAADAVSGTAARGRALGFVLTGAAVGAVIGPNLLGPSGDLASGFGLPRLSGLYLVAVVAFPTAGGLLALLGRRTRRPAVGGAGSGTADARRSRPGARTGGAVLVLAAVNLVMVAVMAIAPLHLVAHGHHVDVIGVAVSVHVLCMLAPAPLAGWLADRVGAPAVARLGAALLAFAAVAGAVADADNVVVFTVVLAVVGLGWCAGVVAGSLMLADSLPDAERPRAEGIGEIAMGVVAGVGAPAAGLVMAFSGFRILAMAAGALSLLTLLRPMQRGHIG